MSVLRRAVASSSSSVTQSVLSARRQICLTASLSAKKAKSGRVNINSTPSIQELDQLAEEESRPPAEHDANPNSFFNLGRDIIFLRGATTFFRNTRSTMLRDLANQIQTPAETREFFEYLKIWRLNGGQIDWDLAQLVIERSMASSSPYPVLYALMNPTSFGLHISSPSRPAYIVPTYESTPPSAQETSEILKKIREEVSTRGDILLFDRRKPHFTTLSTPTPMAKVPASIEPVGSIPVPAFFRDFVRLLFVGSEEAGRSRDLTKEEVAWVAEQTDRHLPLDPVITSLLLNHYSHLPDNSGQAAYGNLQSRLSAVVPETFAQQELTAEEKSVVRDQLEASAFPLKWAGEVLLPLAQTQAEA
ncbi:hypothetical protein [Phaffia rhodozyma]|uniref:Uncharacterized protein n=1 Tax=Phaffia rhodozyma TaxID=264483 RepID=A0A0F7SNA5_PHARH|nr:hypothetical protein [Phaffia rhodozyma]